MTAAGIHPAPADDAAAKPEGTEHAERTGMQLQIIHDVIAVTAAMKETPDFDGVIKDAVV